MGTPSQQVGHTNVHAANTNVHAANTNVHAADTAFIARLVSADDTTEKDVVDTNCCAVIEICLACMPSGMLTWTKA